MKVRLLSCTRNPIDVVYVAGKCCRYKNIRELIASLPSISLEEREEFIRKLIQRGHESVLEHASFTFLVEGISRVATHQLVRHRIASYSQFSHRQTDPEIQFTLPDRMYEVMETNPQVDSLVKGFLDQAAEIYATLVQAGVPAEDARYLLPQGVESSLVFTMNAREIRHFLKLRLTPEAQREIRELAKQVLDEVALVALVFVEDVVEWYRSVQHERV